MKYILFIGDQFTKWYEAISSHNQENPWQQNDSEILLSNQTALWSRVKANVNFFVFLHWTRNRDDIHNTNVSKRVF